MRNGSHFKCSGRPALHGKTVCAGTIHNSPGWLDRARRFAMHAIEQRSGERGLWAGDLGVALYAADCLDARSAYPLVDTSG